MVREVPITGKHKGHEILLISNRFVVEVDKVPVQGEYKNLLKGTMTFIKKLLNLVS